MSSTSSALFGDFLSKSKFRPGTYNPSSVLGGLGQGLNTNLSAPSTSGGTLGGNSGFIGSPEMQILRDEKDPFVKMELLRRMGEEREMKNLPGIIKTLRDQQREDRLAARPLEFQELVATNLLNTITRIPGQIAAARQMYGPEAATAAGRQMQNFSAPAVPRYF
jgi:hypothetical protein